MMQNKVKSALFKTDCCSSLFENDYIKIKIVGIINTSAFQKARICAEKLYQHMSFKFTLPQIIEMFQIDWHEYIEKMKRQIGGKMWSLKRPVAVFINNEFIGSDMEFFHYISEDYIFSLPFGIEYYENIAIERCKQFMEKSKRIYVYFTFTINNRIAGSFVFMLYSDLLPLTCQHFLNLCNGYDEVKHCYRDAYYINTRVHRIVKNGWIQCGDAELSEISEDRAGNVPVIPDESYCIPHDRRGVLSMANDGKHCNQFQFIVCLKPNPWMNHYYVAFGQLIDGARTLKILESISTYYEHPIKQILILQCGEYCLEEEPKMEAESQVFLKHQPPSSIEGEATRIISDNMFDFYCITPWLDNIVDVIDVRDTASLLMVERYLNGLYCLSTDYMPGMDMRVYKKLSSVSIAKRNTTVKLYQLLRNFQPDNMTELEKRIFISDISEIIIAYIFYHEHNENV
ncbi:putative inactive peptidyl-prolyl cis-trans isomerase-like 6 isoform X2 [Osmia lignaria lignaria]|uniref:putative inactive peptidyl-prolyl cis-trans isomerase-like 6 isoform X2 n=1 Tax=Osmia lignaria lignaria TaxID=1437193 RepID=UPI001478ABE8|nr:probable inactive peptidyl-prolyl cis-trans isomerase-like 6 isoform X2 [Osmia lignaria]